MHTPVSSDRRGTIHLVFSSHWDREWYLPFQKFRAKLVRMLDVVFRELEAGRLPFYQMDGQFIPVEDYLEIRPEKEPLVRRLIAEGKFRVGPWYNLPDGFLVSGESIVRNFLLGMKRADAFGGSSPVGWLCDIFGHNSQMPQVLRQLGIDNAFLWRGVDLSLGDRFWWEGGDGSRVLVHRFPATGGYSAGGMRLRKITQARERLDAAQLLQQAREWLKAPPDQRPQERSHMLWFDGADHMEFDPLMLEMVRAFNDESPDGWQMEISTLDHYARAMREEGAPEELIWRGEMREACPMDGDGWLIPGVGSSRIPLKQANHACETLLTLWVEPWAAVASLRHGLEWPAQAFELSWEYLLRNHPHDSICGCSTDETHAAMPYRFDQSRQIAEAHLDDALRVLAAGAHHAAGTADEEAMALTLFTPAGGTVQMMPEVTFQLPEDWPRYTDFFNFEGKPSLRVFTPQGAEVPCQLLEFTPKTVYAEVPEMKFPHVETRLRVRAVLDLQLEPFSITPLVIRRAEGPTRISQVGAIGISRDELQNEFLHIQAQRDGTLTLTDRVSGCRYAGLLTLEDTADIGDGWFHGPSLQDRAYLSTGGQVTFGVMENGPLLARLHIRVEWLVPQDFDFGTMRRNGNLAPLVVEHVVTLRRHARHAEISTTVHNTIKDHRLRLLCPSGLAEAKSFWADSPFDAVERPISLRADNHLLREMQVEMTPQQNWVAIAGREAGLGLLAPGQYESGVLDQPDRPLALTLLRSFRRAVMTDGNEGGQIQGMHRFNLGLLPFSGETVPVTTLGQLAQTLAAPARVVFRDVKLLKNEPIPATHQASSWPQVKGAVIVSACHLDGEGVFLFRVFNPANTSAEVTLEGGAGWTKTDLRDATTEDIGTSVVLRAKELATLKARV